VSEPKASMVLDPDEIAIVLGSQDGNLTVRTEASPQIDTLFETDEDEIELPLNAALAMALSNRIAKDDSFVDDVLAWHAKRSRRGRKILVLEPRQLAIVLGEAGEHVSRQLVTTSGLDRIIESEEEEVEMPLHLDLAFAIMMRLEKEPAFFQEMLDWSDAHIGTGEEEEQTPPTK
jgi:hypothetical protein